VPDIFDEVQEDLRADAARRMARRYSGAGVAAVIVILAGTGGYVWWQNQQKTRSEAEAARYIAAAAEADKSQPGAAAQLAAIAASGPAGYRILANLRLAALDWQTGHQAQAVAAWQAVSGDGSAPQLLRDLATLARLQHQLDSGDPKILKPQAEALTGADNPWRPMAELVVAMLDLRENQPAEAADVLKRLSADFQAPPGIREMAGDLVQTIDVPPAPASDGSKPPPLAKPPGAKPPSQGPGIH
jgi:hypothetical protein